MIFSLPNGRKRIQSNSTNQQTNFLLLHQSPISLSPSLQNMSASKQTYRVCFCFRRRFKLIEPPAEVKTLFELYSENGVMTVDHLHRFLVEFQGEDKATKEDAQAIIDASKHLLLQRRGLHLDSFFRYLFGDTNPPMSPTLRVHHDMTAPLSHYFIYTGHNSYLTGNQLSSDCSDVPIIMALERGVRVIKLDMWPNSAKDNIDILHGRTLTTPVSLLKCLRSIKEHAFSASPFPLVITLEDHLTPDLQAKVAVMVTETFGDMLFASGKDSVKELPSPDSLKNRVLISTKPPKEYLESKSVKEKRTASQKDNDSAEEEVWAKEVPDLKSKLEADNKGYGRYLWLMHGMFRANGECGYLKKPDFLLNVGPHNEVFDPKASLPVKQILKVMVFMGEGWYSDFLHTNFYDMYSPPDLYTKIGIAGVPADSRMLRTKIIEDDWTPVWNEEFEFPLTVPELALLRIECHEYDMSGKADFCGQTCLPVSELRTGIRAVPLYDHKGNKYKCVKILMRFVIISG